MYQPRRQCHRSRKRKKRRLHWRAPAAPAADVVPTPLVLATVEPPTPVLGDTARCAAADPAELPRRSRSGIRYSFDLEVDVETQSLVQIDVVQAPETTLNIFVSPDDQTDPDGPVARVYAASVGTGVVARYVSEAPITTTGTVEITAACSAEANAQTFSTTFDNQHTYTFASIETNISVEELRTTTVAALGDIPLAEDGREILVRAAGYPDSGGLPGQWRSTGALYRAQRRWAAGDVQRSDLRRDTLPLRGAGKHDDHRNGVPANWLLRAIPALCAGRAGGSGHPAATAFTVIDTRVYQFIATGS